MELMKRAVWCSILQSNAVVTNAEELHQTAQNVCKKINILFICKRSVSKETVKLRERWECCKAITQTNYTGYGLPQELIPIFNSSSSFSLPSYRGPLIAATVDGLISFKGNSLIAQSDDRDMAILATDKVAAVAEAKLAVIERLIKEEENSYTLSRKDVSENVSHRTLQWVNAQEIANSMKESTAADRQHVTPP